MFQWIQLGAAHIYSEANIWDWDYNLGCKDQKKKVSVSNQKMAWKEFQSRGKYSKIRYLWRRDSRLVKGQYSCDRTKSWPLPWQIREMPAESLCLHLFKDQSIPLSEGKRKLAVRRHRTKFIKSLIIWLMQCTAISLGDPCLRCCSNH